MRARGPLRRSRRQTRLDRAPLVAVEHVIDIRLEQFFRQFLLVKRAANNAETSFRFSEDQGARVFYWIDGPFGYALAGELPRAELQVIARAIYQQLNP
jgi:anti-sigma factor RsiW